MLPIQFYYLIQILRIDDISNEGQSYSLDFQFKFLLSLYQNLSIYQRITKMSMFRSADMKYYEIYIPKEDTYETVSKLANHNFVEFLQPTQNNFHKPYFNSVKRCEEVLNKIDCTLKQVRNNGLDLGNPPIVAEILSKQSQSTPCDILVVADRKISTLILLDELEDEVQKRFTSVDKLTKSLMEYERKIKELSDYKYLLFKAREIFSSKPIEGDSELDFSKTTLEQLRLVNVSGVIESKDIFKFSKIIFRATKGNSILYTFNIPKQTNKEQLRSAFILILESGQNALTKVNRICDSYQAKTYCLPTNKEDVFGKIKQIEDSINDTKQLWIMTQKSLKQQLGNAISTAAWGCGLMEAYRVLFQREVLIFNNMNRLEQRYNTLVAKVWVPKEKIGLLFSLVPSFVNIRQQNPKTKPPTYFQLNEFTAPFQQIIDTYGTPRYQQVNPALYAISIFPFLFGVMFGDIGHGGAMLAFSLFLIYYEKARIMLPQGYKIRYLLLLMGIFSFYAGWIYNQFFSIPLNVFGSCYGHAQPEQYAQKAHGCVYPIGFDPKWIRASNQLNFFNSYKMKFAVIIGVAQMTFAIFLKFLNSMHFKNYLDVFFEWLPQQVFFFCTFGYMCFLIIYKWTIHWVEQRDTSTAPTIIGQMIALPLQMGSTEGKPLWDMQSQQALQKNLLIISLICVPLMLIPKPLILWFRMCCGSQSAPRHEHHQQQQGLGEQLNAHKDDFDIPTNKQLERTIDSQSHDADHDNQIDEIVVHQIIETIEFVLGTISNTASYLRLWALSLAHGQLARVFFQKTLGEGMVSANVLIILIGEYFFFNITIGVIMGMDIMECFLHALRLQWVEFNGKFFKADGWKFRPLCLEQPLQDKVFALRTLWSQQTH